MTVVPPFPAQDPEGDACGVLVCRGCCCGSSEKNPSVDHEAQLALFTGAAPGSFRMRVVDCLGPCREANVVVVRPSRAGRRAGGRPQWIRRVEREEPLVRVLDWISRGGPGIAEMPAVVADHAMPAPRRDNVR
jgi:hypothetical protein